MTESSHPPDTPIKQQQTEDERPPFTTTTAIMYGLAGILLLLGVVGILFVVFVAMSENVT